jgi:hypothetical protein
LEKISFIRVVSPIELYEIPDNRVIDDVEGKNLSIESFFLENNEKNKEISKIENSFVELGGMEKRADGYPCQVRSILITKNNSPGDIAFAAKQLSMWRACVSSYTKGQTPGQRPNLLGKLPLCGQSLSAPKDFSDSRRNVRPKERFSPQ